MTDDTKMTPEDNNADAIVLARIDERTRLIQGDVIEIKRAQLAHKMHVETTYVTRDRFTPVERITYGVVTVVLIAVFGGLIGLLINK